ncbi:MAG: molecular chaperone DnaJ [Thermoplasmatota archaeon]
MKKDYYEILGVAKDAQKAEVEKAYRKLALKYHPDRNPDDPSAAKKFTEVTEAYEVLSDENKRSQYDQFGFATEDGEMPNYQYQHVDLDEALRMFMRSFGGGFGSFFGGGDPFEERSYRRRGPIKGDDRLTSVRITLEEAVAGVDKELEVVHLINCPVCGGSGSAQGEEAIECPECSGSGSQRLVKNLGPVQYVTTKTCSRCNGEGQIIKDPCQKCKGKKRVRERINKSITIPPGVDTGNRLRVAGLGDSGERGAPPGDLFVAVEVRPHPFFDRVGDDVKCDININYPQAVLGTKVEIRTLHGPVEVKIPSGTQPNSTLRIKGKGMPSLRGGRRIGDLYVNVRVDVPKHPGIFEKKAIKKLAEVQGENIKFNY